MPVRRRGPPAGLRSHIASSIETGKITLYTHTCLTGTRVDAPQSVSRCRFDMRIWEGETERRIKSDASTVLHAVAPRFVSFVTWSIRLLGRSIFIRDLEPRLHMRPVAVSCIGGLGSSPKSFKNRALQDLQRKRTETVYR